MSPSPVCLPVGAVYHDAPLVDGFANFALAMVPISILYFSFCFAYLYVQRNKYVMLRRRQYGLIGFSVGFAVVYTTLVLLRDGLGWSRFPCWVFQLISLAAVPCIAGPFVLRLAIHASQLSLTVLRAKNETLKIKVGEVSRKSVRDYLYFALVRSPQTNEELVDFLMFPSSKAFAAFWLSLILVPYVIYFAVRIAVDQTWRECYGCGYDINMTVFLFVTIGILFVAGIKSALHLRRQGPDALGVIREFIMAWIAGGALVLTGLIFQLVDPGGVQNDQRSFNWLWFNLIGIGLMEYIATVFQIGRARRRLVKMLLSTSDTASPAGGARINGKELLKDIIADKQFFEMLHSHMVNELSVEILDFIVAVDAWRAFMHDPKAAASASATTQGPQQRAREIYDDFIARGSPREVNLPSSITDRAHAFFGRGNVTIDVFDEAYEEAMKLLLTDCLPRFVNKNKQSLREAIGRAEKNHGGGPGDSVSASTPVQRLSKHTTGGALNTASSLGGNNTADHLGTFVVATGGNTASSVVVPTPGESEVV